MKDRTNYRELIRQLKQRIVRLQWWRDDAMRRARKAIEPQDRAFYVREARVHNRAIVWRQLRIREYRRHCRRPHPRQATPQLPLFGRTP